MSQIVGTNNDSTEYLEAVQIFHLVRPLYFPPGYPALVGLVGLLAGEDLGRWLALVQHGMIVLGAVWMYALLRKFMREDLALLGALLGAAAVPALSTAQNVMSEAPSCFAMVGALYFGVRCAGDGENTICCSSRRVGGFRDHSASRPRGRPGSRAVHDPVPGQPWPATDCNHADDDGGDRVAAAIVVFLPIRRSEAERFHRLPSLQSGDSGTEAA